MSESKRKERHRKLFLEVHPLCIYCGNAATTTDHCPPRCFFSRRQWPETYEFPACNPCNSEARLDEQGLAVLVRAKLTEQPDALGQQEWEKLAQGVRNNQPKLLAEWGMRRNEVKQALRSAFGRHRGDLLRSQGWGSANIGPLTEAMTTRFMVKVGQALYYRHNGHLLDGVLYANHIDVFARDTTPEFINGILRAAPSWAAVQRNRMSLSDQFIYRFNHKPEFQMMYAVVQFGDQFIFQLIALGRKAEADLILRNNGAGVPLAGRHECYLGR
jgi:hypothetical protein